MYVISIGSIALEVDGEFVALTVQSEPDLPKILVQTKCCKPGDWVIVQDAHEVISFPQSATLNITLKDTLIRIGQEPYGFNAVALSTFFMQEKDGSLFPEEFPFKVFSLKAWNVGNGRNDEMWPAVDTLKHRVKIWRQGDYSVTFVTIPPQRLNNERLFV